MPVFKDGNIVVQNTQYIPAIIKLYDEILVNARDQKVRLDESKDKNIIKVSNIKVEFDSQKNKCGQFTMMVMVLMLQSIQLNEMKRINLFGFHGLILGELLTSKNYNKKGKTTGRKEWFRC